MYYVNYNNKKARGRRRRDRARIVIGFTTTCRGVLDTTLCDTVCQ